jgi:hypothetical protein
MGEKLKQLDRVPDQEVAGLQDRLKNLTDSREFEIAQSAVDVAGIVDPTPISDGISAAMSVAKGDWVGAGLSVVSMVPYLGDAVGKTAKGARTAKKLAELADEIKKTAKALEDAIAKRAIANRKAAAEEARKARSEAANACKTCSAEQKWGSQVPATGKWEGPRGNSRWTSEDGKYSVDYKEGYPDFKTAKGPEGKPIVLDEVEIPSMKGNHGSDFTDARRALKDKPGAPDWPGNKAAPTGYTWHHHEDGVTMQLVRTDVHNKASSGAAHTGGASVVKDPVF